MRHTESCPRIPIVFQFRRTESDSSRCRALCAGCSCGPNRADWFVAGPGANVQFMVKDSRKYASTGGLGFTQFNDANLPTRWLDAPQNLAPRTGVISNPPKTGGLRRWNGFLYTPGILYCVLLHSEVDGTGKRIGWTGTTSP